MRENRNFTSEILAVCMSLAIDLPAFDNDDRFQYLFADSHLPVGIYELEFTFAEFKNYRISPCINSQCTDLSGH